MLCVYELGVTFYRSCKDVWYRTFTSCAELSRTEDSRTARWETERK